jgi:CspA family cold shock protein
VYTGKVKWFNNKRGYGFISALIDDVETDIFVHHSALITSDHSVYRFLVQGESVTFELVESTDSGHEIQASAVRSPTGALKCETVKRHPRLPENDA